MGVPESSSRSIFPMPAAHLPGCEQLLSDKLALPGRV